MSEKLKIALICFDNPFLRPMEGGKRAMLTRIQSLLRDDLYEVDIYLHNKVNEGMASNFGEWGKKARAVYQCTMNSGVGAQLSWYPICVNKRFSPEYVQMLKQRVYDVAIYEGEQSAKYRLENVVNAKHHIIYMHDLESQYRKEIARTQNKAVLKIANRLEAMRFRKIEKQIDKLFDRSWFISKDECQQFGRYIGKPEKCLYMPFPALTIRQEPIVGNKQHKLLYVGDMSIVHNYLSVEWFARKVFPEIQAICPDAEFEVVGRLTDDNANTLRSLGVNVLGYVDDLNALYEEAACVVGPVLYGAGVKVKTIDALAIGQIVVTTTKGVEGTELQNGKHLIVEDDAKKMAELCTQVLLNRSQYDYIARNGLQFIKEKHTIAYQAELINSEIEQLCK